MFTVDGAAERSGSPGHVYLALRAPSPVLTGTKGTRPEAQRAEPVGGRELLQNVGKCPGGREVTPGHPNQGPPSEAHKAPDFTHGHSVS